MVATEPHVVRDGDVRGNERVRESFNVNLPGLAAALLHWIFDDHTAEDLYPFVLVFLAVPLGLAIAPRTRRFGLYMLIGVVTTALVVLGVAAVVLWVLVGRENHHGGSL